MKKFVTFLATMALAIPAPLAVSTPAVAKNANVEFCKGYVGSDPAVDPNLNRGEWISYLTTGDNYYNKGGAKHAYAVHQCDYFAENYPDDFDLIWGSKSACIKDIESTLCPDGDSTGSAPD